VGVLREGHLVAETGGENLRIEGVLKAVRPEGREGGGGGGEGVPCEWWRRPLNHQDINIVMDKETDDQQVCH